MLTAGGAITAAMRFLVNVGSDAYLYDVMERARAEYLAREYAAELWTMAPHHFRLGDGTVTLTAGNGYGSVPTDFSSFGEQGHPYIQNAQTPLGYLRPDELLAMLELSPGPGVPTHYTLHGRDPLTGLQRIYTYPVNSATTVLSLRGYKKRVPDLIDYPVVAPTVAPGSAGALTGAYSYRVSYSSNGGIQDTEGGTASATITPAAQRVALTGIPVSGNPAVTERNIWRTEAGGEEYRLLTTLDSFTTTYTDNVADASLGADVVLTGLNAITGMEQFPEDFHELLFVRGLAAKLNPERPFDWEGHRKMAKRLWSDQKQGQNVVTVMPRYGQGVGGGGYRSRLRNVI